MMRDTSNMRVQARADLAQGLTRRMPTWRVADRILDLGVIAEGSDLHVQLQRLAMRDNEHMRRSYEQCWAGDDFDRVDGCARQAATVGALFGVDLSEVDPSNPAAVQALIRRMLAALGLAHLTSAEQALVSMSRGEIHPAGDPVERFMARAHEHDSFPGSRAPKRVDGVQAATGMRTLRKRLRALKRLEDKCRRMELSLSNRNAQMTAKSRLARLIDADACSDITLAYCAHLAAAANQRSIFQVGSQKRAFDEIGDQLFKLVKNDPDAAWDQIVLVRPTPPVMAKIDPARLGELIGLFHAQMAHASEHLAQLWSSMPERMHAEMVMVRGVDSSRWNAYAGQLNAMRSAWINALLAAGLDAALDSYLPGKAARLIAGDVAWMYRGSGQELHADTRMFAALPKAWDVVSGSSSCTRADIERTARQLQVSAQDTGWVGPRAAKPLEMSAIEPMLVHGVIVSDPQLAATLRRCGVFSAKQLRRSAEIPDVLIRAELAGDEERVQPAVIAGLNVPFMQKPR